MQEDYNDREECKIFKQCKGANQQTRQHGTKARQKKLTMRSSMKQVRV